MRRFYLAALVAGVCLSSTVAGRGQQTPASPSIDKGAMTALEKMGAYMRTLSAFQIHSTTSREDVLDDGQKIASDGVVDILVRRPDRLMAEIDTDLQHRSVFYNGKTFTIWAQRMNYYASVPAPSTLAELIDVLDDKYGIELPLSDLFYWGTDKSKISAIKSAIDAGPSQVEGVSCEHYAFRQDGLDWQLWIQNGDYPLPRKFVVTTMTDDARPQYTSVITWNLAPSFDDGAFTFTAPPDSHKIVLTEIKSGGSPDRR